MLKDKPAAARTSAAVTLLDCYDLRDELILAPQRPVPCTDLIDFINSEESSLQGHKAEVSSWWRVSEPCMSNSLHVSFFFPSGYNETASGWSDWDPLQGCFPQGHKLDKIQVETCCDVPRARIINFGAFLSVPPFVTIKLHVYCRNRMVHTPLSDSWMAVTGPSWLRCGSELSCSLGCCIDVSSSAVTLRLSMKNPDLSASLSLRGSKTHTYSRIEHMQKHTHRMVKRESL